MFSEPRSPSRRPLEDVTVIDLTVALAGPYATLLLAGLGARVIKVENPSSGDTSRTNAPYLGREGLKLVRESDDDISLSAINRLRNKLGVTLNLKHPRARDVLTDLLRQADAVVENFSQGTLDRLGVGYDFARQVNPRIVYCSITGFGSDGEAGSQASGGKAMDTIIQALSGITLASGGPTIRPVRVGLPIADMVAPFFAVIGTLAAIHQARQTGIGQFVDVSMLGALTSLVAGEHFDVLERLGVPLRTGPTLPRLAPFGIYRAQDGYLAICAPMNGFAHALFRAMGRPDLIADERFGDRDQRVKHVHELDALIEAWTSRYSLSDLLPLLDGAGVPAGEVRDPLTAVRDPHTVQRGETVRLTHPIHGDVDEVYGIGLPIGFSASAAGFDRPAPLLGEHNDAVYGGILGYSSEQLEGLRRQGVI